MDIRSLLIKLTGVAYRLPHLPSGTELYGSLVIDSIGNIPISTVANEIERNLYTNITRVTFELMKEKRALPLITSEIGSICVTDPVFGEDLIDNLSCADLTDLDGLLAQALSEIRAIKMAFSHDEAVTIITAAAKDLKYNSNTIPDIPSYINTVVTKLTPHTASSDGKHPSEIDQFDAEDENKLVELFTNAKNVICGDKVLRTGWKALNDMLQGGFRQGETTIIPALQHRYKTSGTLSIFRQLCQYNTPEVDVGGKKPMLIRVSFEDSLDNNLIFLYQNIVFNETGVMPEIHGTSAKEMARTVRACLRKTGFSINFRRYNSGAFSYMDLLNIATRAEHAGYSVKLLMADYLLKCNLEGVDQSGPSGHAQRNLFERVRDGFAAKDIAFVTPAQLGPRAKSVLSAGIAPQEFLGRIAGQGMTSGSSQIDQVVDVSFYFHIVTVNHKSYLHILLDKHRLPTVVSATKKEFFLPFPDNGCPIQDDVLASKGLHRRHISTVAAEADDLAF